MPQIRVPHAHRLLKESIRESEINRRREKKNKQKTNVRRRVGNGPKIPSRTGPKVFLPRLTVRESGNFLSHSLSFLLPTVQSIRYHTKYVSLYIYTKHIQPL